MLIKNEGWLFCDINRCKLSVKNALLCLEYEKDFSQLGSESNEGMKNNESANNRTINLFSPWIKSSLQMSGVKDSPELH